jgi:hypothetical protein
VLPLWSCTAFGQADWDQPAVEQPTAPTAMTTPAMTGPLAANPNPMSFHAGPLGPVYLTGAVSGLGLWQKNKFPDEQHAQARLGNGQVFPNDRGSVVPEQRDLVSSSYTYNSAPWTVTPYFQFTHVLQESEIGGLSSASTIGGAILANYSFADDSPLPGVSLPLRFEYIGSTGSATGGAPNLLYGPGSNAWSITFSPTYQYKIFFARAEISHVGTSSTTPGPVFGPSGTNTTQTRGVLEVGILF